MAVPLPDSIAEVTEITEGSSERSAISSHTGVALGATGAVPATSPGPENEAFQVASLICMKILRKPSDHPAGEYLGI